MPSVPGSFQSTSVIQNQTTGVVDFLKYSGNQVVASSEHDYGLGSDFKIVASGYFGNSGNPELVAQSQSSGQLDFLDIDANGNLTSSFMTNIPGGLPAVHGAGYFGAAVPNQSGPELVGQLANGQIDFLAFDQNYNFIASDLVANSAGLPTLVGAGDNFNFDEFQLGPVKTNVEELTDGPQFQSLGQNGNYSLLTQLSDGTLDAIGFSGSFADGSLSFASSFLLPQTQGSGTAYATNVSTSENDNIPDQDNGTAGVQVFTQSDQGYDALYLDSGYNSDTQGAVYGSNLLQSFAGWNVVDGGTVLNEIYPAGGQPVAFG